MMKNNEYIEDLMKLADWHFEEHIHECPDAFENTKDAYRAGILMGYIIRQGEEITGSLLDPESDFSHYWETEKD